jgi:rhamnosyltransferase
VLDRVAAQQIDAGVETVAVDSGSRDGTVTLLEGRVDRMLRIPPAAFNHGLTRNLGIAQCRGDLVVLLVQDALPAADDWLARLTRPLREDGSLAGTFARQLPRPEASALARHALARYRAADGAGWVSAVEDAAALRALPPSERLRVCTFDNVCSAIRRAVWQRHPFREAPIAEDLEWAREVLLAGYRLAFVPEAVVLHSHERSARYELYRTYLVHRRLRLLFGLQTIPTARHLVRAILASLATHLALVAKGPPGPRPWPREAARALALAVSWPLGQYLGARAADTGRDLLEPRGV